MNLKEFITHKWGDTFKLLLINDELPKYIVGETDVAFTFNKNAVHELGY